jgi:ABC-2 type transport system permease protein
MHKAFLIAARDYKAAVRTKAFIFSLLLMPLLMGSSIAMQFIFQKQTDTEDKRFAVVDRTPDAKVFADMQAAAGVRNDKLIHDPATGEKVKSRYLLESVTPSEWTAAAIDQQRLELSERVRKGEFWGFVEIGPDNCMPPRTGSAVPSFGEMPWGKNEARGNPVDPTTQRVYLRYQTDHPTALGFPRWLEAVAANAIFNARLHAARLSAQDIQRLLQPVPLESEGLSQRDPVTGAIIDPPMINRIARYVVPVMLVALMFIIIMMGSTPAMQGVVEEKMQRIAEVLLGSVRPFHLMLGKLLGTMAVSLTMAGIYLAGGFWLVHHFGVAEVLPIDVIIWFLVYLVLAILMYGSVFLAIGAAATDIKETQTMVMPVILFACIPMLVLTIAVEEPNNVVVAWTSFFPPVTPMLMLIRQSVPPGIAWWQPALGVLLVLGFTTACVYAAGRIFRIGILMQGKGAKISQLVQWVFRG